MLNFVLQCYLIKYLDSVFTEGVTFDVMNLLHVTKDPHFCTYFFLVLLDFIGPKLENYVTAYFYLCYMFFSASNCYLYAEYYSV